VAGNKVVAVAEERLNRTRYSGGWQAALAYCLQAADIAIADVGAVVFSCVGPRLEKGFTGGLDLYGVPAARITTADHHLSHAYSAFCLSGADEALVVVADGSGNDHQTESYFLADRTAITKVGGNREGRGRAGGIGATYEAVTNWLGFDGQESGKTMALASYGDAKAIEVPLFDLPGTQVEGHLARTHDRGLAEFAQAAGVNLGARHVWDTERARDLAAWVQAQTEEVLAELIARLMAEHRRHTVCLAGGVAMNCVANEVIRRRADARLFVPPPASDRGQALGNALHGIHLLTGTVPRMPLAGRDAFGRTYTPEEIQLALRRHPRSGLAERHPHRPFGWRRESDPAATAAELLADGQLVGWFDGGSELGARALGSRSILADPRHPATRDVLNTRIKHREFFRPFAPAVPAEHTNSWFDLDQDSPYMLFAPQVRSERRDQLGAVTHVDGTARVQTVDAGVHPAFHRLISRFGELTGVPVVLNTSFNDSEPIVESPAHAVATFCHTDLDALVFSDGFVAVKNDG
jgi:carbamoyltransferase